MLKDKQIKEDDYVFITGLRINPDFRCHHLNEAIGRTSLLKLASENFSQLKNKVYLPLIELQRYSPRVC